MGCAERGEATAGRDRGYRKKVIDALRWHHKWGAALKGWQRQIEEGREPSAEFYRQPEIDQAIEAYWSAFGELSTERQIGMGLGPIPRSKIREFVRDEVGLSGDAHEMFCEVIFRVDSDYVAMANETKPKDNEFLASVDDVEGVMAVFDVIDERKNKAARNGRMKA